ncbi:MAG TPA: hypothetical protein ENN12_00115 [Epsilonproteobacteria bacterium]|nr:hypothetical protein [Campylobacterota bacterium]
MDQAKAFLEQTIQSDYEYDLEEHLAVINQALCDDKLCKMHILDSLNRIICADTITQRDYEEFERVKKVLFCDKE